MYIDLWYLNNIIYLFVYENFILNNEFFDCMFYRMLKKKN